MISDVFCFILNTGFLPRLVQSAQNKLAEQDGGTVSVSAGNAGWFIGNWTNVQGMPQHVLTLS